MSDPVNPYESPRTPDELVRDDHHLREGVESRLVASGLLYRRVIVDAPIEATIEFNGRSVFRDVVKVDGEVVASKISWWRINSLFDFALRAGERLIPVVVRLQMGRLLRLKGFRIEMAGKVVYNEGEWNDSVWVTY
ncbi:MAG: hypothetical protein QGF59_26155 [Pirellulaceae bacterium]|nr:hypothetical protein [Pirellulaceae bacterium]